MGGWDALTIENLYGSWEIHYEPVRDREFDEWLHKQDEPKERFIGGEELDD